MVALVSELRPDSSVVAEVRPSPNHGERKGSGAPDMIVLHYTGMADSQAAVRQLCSPTSEVSSHYVVLQDGYIIQMVAERGAPGTRASRSGPERATSIRARSASRSPIPDTTTAIRIFRSGRSRQ